MSDTSGPGAGDKAGKAAKAGRQAKPGKAAKLPKSPLRGWDADGANFSRTMAYGSPDQAMKGAKRALGSFQKAGRPVEVRLDGSDVTVRVTGPVDEDLKKLAKRIAPKDPAKKAERAAARAAKAPTAGGDA